MLTLTWLNDSLSAGAFRPGFLTYLVRISRLFFVSQDAMHEVWAVKQDTLNRQQLSMLPDVNILYFHTQHQQAFTAQHQSAMLRRKLVLLWAGK